MVHAASEDPWVYLKIWSTNTPEDRPLYGVGEFLGIALNVLLGTALAASMIFIIMSGIKIITSKGDPKAKAESKQAVTFSVVALILAIGAFTVKTILFNVMGGNFGDLSNATPNF